MIAKLLLDLDQVPNVDDAKAAPISVCELVDSALWRANYVQYNLLGYVETGCLGLHSYQS